MGKGREGKGREGKGREGKGREGKGREGKGKGKSLPFSVALMRTQVLYQAAHESHQS